MLSFLKNKALSTYQLYYLLYIMGILTAGLFVTLNFSKIAFLLFFPIIVVSFIYNYQMTFLALFLMSFYYNYPIGTLITLQIKPSYLLSPIIILLLFIMRISSHGIRMTTYKETRIAFYVFLFIILLSMVTANYRIDSILWIIVFLNLMLWFQYFKYLIDSVKKLNFMFLLLNISALLVFLTGLNEIGFSNRAQSVLDSANSMGGYCVFYILINIYIARSSKSILLKIFSVFIMILSTVFLIGSQSRGAQVGMLTVLLLYLVINNLKNLKKLVVYLSWLLMSIIMIIFKFGGSFFSRYSNLSVSNIDIATLDRIGMWYAAIKLFLSSPLFGVGLNNYFYFYLQYHLFYKVIHIKQLRIAHNIFLNTLAEMGIIGFLGLMIILILLGIVIKRLIINKNLSDEGKELSVIVLCYYIYFLVHNMFDCIWTNYGHLILPFQGMLVLLILVKIESFFTIGKETPTDKEIIR